jgi:PAS domain S-box-containing protein
VPRTSTPSSTASLPDISFFADVFRDSAIPTIIMGPNSRVLFWNAAMERLFGWSAEEVLGQSLPLVPPEEWEEHLQMRQLTQDGKGFSRHRIIRRDKAGKLVEVSMSTWPIRGADGHVIGYVGIYVEVQTEELRFRRSLAEKQLEEIERLYATAPIGLCFLDTDLRFVRVNERLAQIDSLSAEAHVGRRLAEVVPEVAASMEEIYRKVMATGVPLKERELQAATPALPGVLRVWQVSAYPLKDPDGMVLGLTAAVSDITERKRWNEELERQDALLRLVIDGLPGMVFYVDRDREYRFANRAAGEWFACASRDLEGRKISELLGEATFESVRERVDRALAGEEVAADFRHRYPDRERDVRAHYVPDRAPDGEIRGMWRSCRT